MNGKIIKMSEGTYHARSELNASLLADFADIEDKALLPRQEKQCFDIGHQFEDFVFQEASNKPWFDSKYSVTELDSEEPEKSFNIAKSGVDLEKYLAENHETYFTKASKYTKLNKTNANTYNWIQEHIKSGGHHLISKFNFEMIKKMASNFLDKMKIDLFEDGSEYTVRELLEHAEFQKKIFWGDKKAMLDVLLIWDGTLFILDIKTAAEGQFYNMFKNKYGPIQCRHYTEAGESLIGQYGIERVHHKLWFLAGIKAAESKPLEHSSCIAESYSVHDDDIEEATEKYHNIVDRFYQWDKAGRPKKGWRKHRQIRLYSRYVA